MLPLYCPKRSPTPHPWNGRRAITVRVATAEGLILTKMVAFRPQDQIDIETLLTANRDTIDINLIRQEWAPFAPTEEERTDMARSRDRPASHPPRVSHTARSSPRTNGGQDAVSVLI